MDGLAGFLLAAVALAGSPGPATLSLAAASAAFGARRVSGYFIGILAGMVGVMVIVASGIMGLMAAIPGVTPVVTMAAALYLSALDAVLKIALLAVLIAAVNVAWLLVGAAMTRFFREPRTNRIVNVIFAVLLLASVALAVS